MEILQTETDAIQIALLSTDTTALSQVALLPLSESTVLEATELSTQEKHEMMVMRQITKDAMRTVMER